MKVVINDDLIILFLNKLYIKSLDFKNKEALEGYIKTLLLRLQDNYCLEINGYYETTIYIDKNYGVIIEIYKEELEYLDYFSNQIEVNTKIVEDSFLYEVDNFINNTNFINYTLNGNIYIMINNYISSMQMGILMEKVKKIIYGNERRKLLQKIKQNG